MSGHLQTYQILEGIRRAKAYAMAGFDTVVCKVYRPDATFVGEMDIRIDQSRSLKSVIDISDRRSRNGSTESFERLLTGARLNRSPSKQVLKVVQLPRLNSIRRE